METRDLYLKPPTLLNFGIDYKIFYACKRGKGHVQANTVCQDYCLAESINKDIFVAAVADGHGGEAYVKSDVGSRKACEVLLNLIKDYAKFSGSFTLNTKLKSPEFKESLIEKWQNEVLADYKSENPATQENDSQIIKKYGTTLLFAVVTNLNIIVGQLGDGAILLYNDKDQYQLFKRHNPKMSSKTSSLASSRGLYSFIVESYSKLKFKFRNILLSTDGIYDKLDKKESFYTYAKTLTKQIKEKITADTISPFTVENIDVSQKTLDDCTITAIIANSSDEMYELRSGLKNMASFGYDKVEFQRAYDTVEIYSAFKDGINFEIHNSKYLYPPIYSFDDLEDKFHMLKPEETPFGFCVKGRHVHAYKIPAGLVRIQELIEHGEHLEKKYTSKLNDNDELPSKYTNEFWLNVYETILKLKNLFTIKKYLTEEHFFKTLLVSYNGELYTFPDSLSKAIKIFNDSKIKQIFDDFESQFSLLGKIQCGENVLPIFKCAKYSQGQVVPNLHVDNLEAPLCRVVYNANKKIYGLHNISKSTWYLQGKEVAPSQVLRLDTNQTFMIKLNPNDKISSSAEVTDGLAVYKLCFFNE